MKVEGVMGGSLRLWLPGTVVRRESYATLNLEEQITQLFDELRVPVYRYLLCLNVMPEDADEVIQETFLRLYKHLHSGGREENLRGWVFRVAHNLSLNQMKGRRFLAPTTPEKWAELIESTSGLSPGPEELLLLKEKMAWLNAAISALPPLQQQCLHLRMEGFRYREIAEILAVAVSTVTESLRRAIQKLTREPHG